MDTRVSVLQCGSYGEVQAAVDRHFALLDLDGDFTPQTRVLLKVNLLLKRTPEEFTTTHPALVEAVIVHLKKLGVKDITIADSPGGPYSKGRLVEIYRASGMEAAAERQGVKLNLDTGFRSVGFEAGKTCKNFSIINPIADADYIIDLPKLKTHGMMTMTCAVKNMFGSIPGLQKPEMHFQFPDYKAFASMLVDLALCTKPNVAIVDGVVGMQGEGPSAGEPLEAGITLAARNIYALDLAACRLLGFQPEQLPTVSESIARGLCPEDPAQLTILGEPDALTPIACKTPAGTDTDFSRHVPRLFQRPTRFILDHLSPRPVVQKRICIGCGRCAQSCPMKIIEIREKKAHIAREKCIRCFCCHEMCPVKAISIKKSWIMKH